MSSPPTASPPGDIGRASADRGPRPPTMLDALLPIVVLIALLALTIALFGIDATNGPVAIKAASTAPVAADKALVVGLSPNSAGIITTGTAGTPATQVLTVQGITSGTPQVISNGPLTNFGAGEYETVAAGVTSPQMLGGAGNTGDYLAGVLVVPSSTSPSAITIKDGSNTAITVFAGGATSVSNLVPFFIPLGLVSTSGGWQLTTGASGATAIGIGNFT